MAGSYDMEEFTKAMERLGLQPQQDKVWQAVQEEIQRMASGGQDIDETLRNIDAAFQSLTGAVKTLMLTGVTYARTKAQLKLFGEQGIEEYRIEAIRDMRTCAK